MNERLTKVASMLAQGVSSAVTAVGQFAKECQEQENYIAAQRVAAMRQAQIATQKIALKPEHEIFGSTLARCLDNEHIDCGLKRPRRIEDILCDDDNNNIRINGAAAPDFTYEVKRDALSIGTFSDVVSGRSRAVPAAEIEEILKRSLLKYSTRRGYTFSGVTVDDIPHGKVRITVHNVVLTPEEQLRRNGYYGY